MVSEPSGAGVDAIDSAGEVLNSSSQSLASRFRALFLLRNTKCDRSVAWICKAFSDSSALLKHELAYCLGQMQNPTAVVSLIGVLKDINQEPMVRHEAGEALGAIGDARAISVLGEYQHDSIPEVAETCQLALQRIRYYTEGSERQGSPAVQTIYDSVDPAPASSTVDVDQLSKMLVDDKGTLWHRYRAMFALRNINSPEAIKALAKGLYCMDSALFRHEVAYVLGQIQSPLAIPELSDALRRADESGMVRHECAEALGAIATPECRKLLEEYVRDKERVVRESCEVALDMTDHEQAGDFQYATVG